MLQCVTRSLHSTQEEQAIPCVLVTVFYVQVFIMLPTSLLATEHALLFLLFSFITSHDFHCSTLNFTSSYLLIAVPKTEHRISSLGLVRFLLKDLL